MHSRIEIIDIGASSEALLLRSILESLGARVGLIQAGSPSAFLSGLGASADYILVCGHGESGGFVMGDFASTVDTTALVNGLMPAAAIAKLEIAAPSVVSTGCETGHQHFAEAFRQAGALHYMAPRESPEGSVIPLILHSYFYSVLVSGLDSKTALASAQSRFSPEDHFTSYNF
jgi:hypothetical protein